MWTWRPSASRSDDSEPRLPPRVAYDLCRLHQHRSPPLFSMLVRSGVCAGPSDSSGLSRNGVGHQRTLSPANIGQPTRQKSDEANTGAARDGAEKEPCYGVD